MDAGPADFADGFIVLAGLAVAMAVIAVPWVPDARTPARHGHHG
ncbi:MAG TPA: hypothetical protein VFH03_07640 [Actinoplanes sp.]|nr:hypothetical protein [Actinoplanes sp.]